MGRDTIVEMGEFWKKLVIGLGIIFLPFSSTELQFSLWGATAEATVTQISESACRLGSRTRALSVEYRFTDLTGRQRTEADRLPSGTPKPAIGNEIDIEYCAGITGASRIVGNSEMFLVYFFLGLIFGGISLAEIVRERDESHRRPFAVPGLAK